MFWLRALSLLVPAGIAASAIWLAGQAKQLVYRADQDLIVAVRNAPGPGNPLLPSTGVTREIAELLFDRLLRLDDDLELRPHVANSWNYRHRATVFFNGTPAAASGFNAVMNDRSRWQEWSLVDCIHDGDAVHLISSEPRAEWIGSLVENRLRKEDLAGLQHIRLRLREAIERSFEDFLAGSVEKKQIRHLRYRDDTIADLFLLGESGLFLKELRLYYESNRGLDPEIVERGGVSWVTELDFEISIRDDIQWHDGEWLTADDLLFTFAETTRPGSPWPLRNAFDFVERMEKTGEHAVRVRCREFYAPALERWAKLPLLPQHRFPGAVTPRDWDAFFERPAGTGPYRLESLGPDGAVTLGANRDYFRPVPNQANIRYVVRADAAERRLGLKLGSFDVFQPDEAERRWAISTGAARVVEDIARYQSFVAWNLDRTEFADVRLRKALAHSVNVAAVIGEVANGHAEPWRGLFFPGSWFGEPVADPPEFDPERAAETLVELGWKRSPDSGVWADAKGERLAFSLAYDSGDALHGELAAGLQRAWKAAGVEARLEPLPWNNLVSERLAPRDFDALLLGWELDFTRDQWAVWHSSQSGTGGSNFSGLKDAGVDNLLATLRTTENRDAVIAAANDLQRKIVDLQPCLFLCGTGRAIAFRKDAVAQARPASGGGWAEGPVFIGRAGLHASRPWWTRTASPDP